MPPKKFETRIVDFTQAVGLLVRRIRAAAGNNIVTMTESIVLARIEKEGPATTAELARAESMKPQSMGATVSSLEEMELVERKPHPTDGRQFHIQLTTQGKALRKSMGDAKHTWLTTSFSKLTKEEQEILFKAGEIVRRMVDQ